MFNLLSQLTVYIFLLFKRDLYEITCYTIVIVEKRSKWRIQMITGDASYIKKLIAQLF